MNRSSDVSGPSGCCMELKGVVRSATSDISASRAVCVRASAAVFWPRGTCWKEKRAGKERSVATARRSRSAAVPSCASHSPLRTRNIACASPRAENAGIPRTAASRTATSRETSSASGTVTRKSGCQYRATSARTRRADGGPCEMTTPPPPLPSPPVTPPSLCSCQPARGSAATTRRARLSSAGRIPGATASKSATRRRLACRQGTWAAPARCGGATDRGRAKGGREAQCPAATEAPPADARSHSRPRASQSRRAAPPGRTQGGAAGSGTSGPPSAAKSAAPAAPG